MSVWTVCRALLQLVCIFVGVRIASSLLLVVLKLNSAMIVIQYQSGNCHRRLAMNAVVDIDERLCMIMVS